MRFGRRHASSDDSCAPFDMPTENTRDVSMQSFMLDPATIAMGEELGLDLAAFYGLGRVGVLGDVNAEVASAALFFFAPAIVHDAWNRGCSVMAPPVAAEHYATACQMWGRSNLAGLAGLQRLCELGERVVAGADPAGRLLFAGWRRGALPDDLPGRAAQVLHLLREARGGWHIAAVMATELAPLEALVVHGGPDGAALFGWAGPFPDPAACSGRHTDSEALTDRLSTRDLGMLSPAELRELAELLDSVAAVAPTR